VAGLAAALIVVAAVAALAALVDGLRRHNLSALLEAGASAALAGGAIGLVAGTDSIGVVVAGAAALLAASVLAEARPPLHDVRTTLLAAVVVLLAAEAIALVTMLLEPAGTAWFVAAAIVGGVAFLASLTRDGHPAGILVAAGAIGLLADRGGAIEGLIGLATLVASQLVVLMARVGRLEIAHEAPRPDSRLPELAERLADAVLLFDGRLKLREWNAVAAGLLGLDGGSVGARAEDLLGVALAELPAAGSTVVSRGAVGGLEVAIHRSGDGVMAVVRDPGARPEAERLGQELRSTIEELLRARRTIDLQRAELERSATVDPLTGISSRGAILERLRIEVAEARRYRHPLAVVLIDVDGFAAINQAHGQGGGDAVLRESALRFRLRVREADAIGRAGSDGFLAVLPHTDEGGAAIFAGALRHRLALRPVPIGDARVTVTVSIGVATMRPGEDLDLDGLLARVQEALDSARGAGGDRIALDRLHGLARLEERHAPETPDEGETAQDSGR
jgi:diguanylate cyclase (GGDEF)-like protein